MIKNKIIIRISSITASAAPLFLNWSFAAGCLCTILLVIYYYNHQAWILKREEGSSGTENTYWYV